MVYVTSDLLDNLPCSRVLERKSMCDKRLLVRNPLDILKENLMKIYQRINFCSLSQCLLKRKIFESVCSAL